MKIKFITIFLVLFSLSSFAQANATPDGLAIKKTISYFANSIKSKKIDQAINCIYPGFFTVISKDQMTQLMNMTYNNPFVKIDVQDLKFGNIEKPELIKGEYFSIANYYLKMKGNVSSMEEPMRKNIGEMLTSKYGKANVKYIASEGSYIINAPMRACAISKDRKTWKIIVVEKEIKSQLVKVLPKKILDKI
ncbi:hypothetical protein CHRY9390_03071 [Chryseobacterium aquaeductus]|uniref:SnoaL-like domain-containing protein n=1 Tax=Chryseobacterium aquaeductus TaxID=2675056 RepID=A0A9N8MIC3_9FLAO|nr:hypothetical protein [Chryseobacterium aquaeductus]CAA7332349.1 hypothetical protein CHRY9390_03071 [Chryseobacterium potabilaquae]CAD7815953.1 hypothetical protein CHRY9390_03071 [Chryseobacterium aquaeductus]